MALYKSLLNKARSNPENYNMPICHKHIGQLASSIHKRELSDTVIVLVTPGRDPHRAKQVGCFCYRYPTQAPQSCDEPIYGIAKDEKELP